MQPSPPTPVYQASLTTKVWCVLFLVAVAATLLTLDWRIAVASAAVLVAAPVLTAPVRRGGA